jgi:hypothetical protein
LRDHFLLTLGKFSLQDHVHLDASVPSLDWDRMDCVVKSWILDSLVDDLAKIVSSQGDIARDTWFVVESQFLGNREIPSSLKRGFATLPRETSPSSSTAIA